jgi:hypothetical protein
MRRGVRLVQGETLREATRSLDDYQALSDTSEGMGQLVRFLRTATGEDGLRVAEVGDVLTVESEGGEPQARLTTAREYSLSHEDVELLGLDHPLLVSYMDRYRNLPPTEIGVRVRSGDHRSGVLSVWHVTTQGERGETRTLILPLAVDPQGQRLPAWERRIDRLFHVPPATSPSSLGQELLAQVLEPMIHRDLMHRGIVDEHRGYDARLIGWVEVV